jgi:hypothetical protein
VWAQVGTIYATLFLCVSSFFLLLTAMGNDKSPGPLYGIYQYTHRPFGAFVLLMCGLWPLVLVGVLRVIAKRRAGLRAWVPF